MSVPGFIAEIGGPQPAFYRGGRLIGASATTIQPAAINICHRLGQASWDAYGQGDYHKVEFIDFLMTIAGCFD